MEISTVQIRGYRCVRDLEIELGNYTALVGANGAGKSTVLYGLDYFFNGVELNEEDICKARRDPPIEEISVTVTFHSLTNFDRSVLKSYAVGDKAVFRRSWSPLAGEKIVGNAVQGPGFSAVRQATVVADMKEKYASLRLKVPNLPPNTVKAQMLAALDDWEKDPRNEEALEEISNAEANHLFGFTGEAKLNSLIRLVMVPAATNLRSELSQTSRGSALHELIGALMATTVQSVRQNWELEHQTQLDSLATAIQLGVSTATQVHAQRVTKHLSDLVPGAGIYFDAEAPAWAMKGEPSIRTSITIDGADNDVTRQGHGVQRAVMIAMLQAMTDPAPTSSGSFGISRQRPISGDLSDDNRPQLVICIEEPEIYQHPVRARNFARVLSRLSETKGAQVVVATHSPYFVRPEQIACIRRMTLRDGISHITHVTMEQVAEQFGLPPSAIPSLAYREFPRALSEGFFSDAVVLVEGDTDKVVIESVAELLETPLDASGVSVIATGGKPGLRAPSSLLRGLGIKSYVMCDGDFATAQKNHAKSNPNGTKPQEAHGTHLKATQDILDWIPVPRELPSAGSWPYEFGGDTLVSDTCAILKNDLEAELSQWPSFIEAMRSNRSCLDGKNALAYRAGVLSARVDDITPSLRQLVEAVHAC